MGLFRRGRHDKAGSALYREAVAAAREPYFYTALGVPDSLDGRFDMVGLHVFLLIRRLRELPEPGAATAQAVFDAMFTDMDTILREMGVSDLAVGKRVRAMWEALHGRAHAYEPAVDARDPATLALALGRNVWRGEAAPPGAAWTLARAVLAQSAHLSGRSLADLLGGQACFLPAADAAR